MGEEQEEKHKPQKVKVAGRPFLLLLATASSSSS